MDIVLFLKNTLFVMFLWGFSFPSDICLEKWCLNSESEKKLMKCDSKATHLLFIQARREVASGETHFHALNTVLLMVISTSETFC